MVELSDVFADVRSTDTIVALNVHVVAKGHDHGLDLGGKFAGRGEDEGLSFAKVGVDAMED